jgi:hydrogenase maturation protease
VEPHGLDPNTVLAMLRTMGGEVRRLRLVGCEPAALASDEELSMGLSAKVAAAVEPAADLVETVVAELREAAGAAQVREGAGLTEGGHHA